MGTPRLISVITPVFDGGHHYLREAYDSLCAQEMSDGWAWEWCVQEDGSTGVPMRQLPVDDSRIQFGTGLAGRAAVARNMALAQASGIVIRNLDADDLLLPGALMRDIETLRRVAWCVSAALDLLPGGEIVPGPYDPPNGPVDKERFYREQEDDKLSVQATTFAVHTDLIWALGGWTAITGAETVSTLLAAEAVTPGEFIAEPSVLYRKHSAQTTADDKYWNPQEEAARKRFGLMRAKSLRAGDYYYDLGDIDNGDGEIDESMPTEGRQAQAMSRLVRRKEGWS
ncbi:glycosyltransferase [Amycolatopsis japonica]|uniref:glycosyltransferase n=1 Tax=Amycolatopsis japonica TaxID=208439 RepID=UPI00379E3AE3